MLIEPLLTMARTFKPPLWAVLLMVASALLAIAGIGVWRGSVALERALNQARADGRETEKALWEAQIAKSNAEAEKVRAAQVIALSVVERENLKIKTELDRTMAKLEAANETLPNGNSCGLSRDRVRLLPR